MAGKTWQPVAVSIPCFGSTVAHHVQNIQPAIAPATELFVLPITAQRALAIFSDARSVGIGRDILRAWDGRGIFIGLAVFLAEAEPPVLFDWLVTGRVRAVKPGALCPGPRLSVEGVMPLLSSRRARTDGNIHLPDTSVSRIHGDDMHRGQNCLRLAGTSEHRTSRLCEFFSNQEYVAARVNGVIDAGMSSGSPVATSVNSFAPAIFLAGSDCLTSVSSPIGCTLQSTPATLTQAERGVVPAGAGRLLWSGNPARLGQYYPPG